MQSIVWFCLIFLQRSFLHAHQPVYRVAVIPGDGIGKEVVPEGVRALEAVAKKFGFEVWQDRFDFASYDYYAKHGRMMPEDWKEKIGEHDAIYLRRGRLAG